MIDVKAKAKPLYFILVALVLISLTTIIAGTPEKEIKLALEYASGTSFDPENDGVEPLDGAIDLSVSGSELSWNYDSEDICTRWDIYSEQKATSTIVCHGSESCCNSLGLEPYQPNWNDDLILTYGRFDSTQNNIVTAQIISLDSVYSQQESLTADFAAAVNLKIKDRSGKNAGRFDVKERHDGKFDIELGPRGGKALGIASSSDWKVSIKGAKNPDLNARVDKINNNKITTDVFAVENADIEGAEITLPKTGDVNVILRCDDFDFETFACSEWIETDIPFTDNGDTITFNVNHFSGYAGGQITIINVKSYPLVGGDWTVRFTTEGTANLTITAIDGTEFGTDIDFFELKCGDTVLSADYDGTRAFYEDYSCGQEGSESSHVITEGGHYLKFEFGDSVGYANNTASSMANTVIPRKVNATGIVNITARWSPELEQMTMFVCRTETCSNCYQIDSTNVQIDGCLCYNNTLRESNSTCSYPTQETDPTEISFWVKLYNASEWGSCPSKPCATSNINYGSDPFPNSTSILVNHRPYAYDVNVTPENATIISTLICNYQFNDTDMDTMSAVNFSWYVNGGAGYIMNETHGQTFSGGFYGGNLVKCSVIVTDSAGLPDA